MGAPCKLRSSKPGKGTQQTLMLLKRHSITVRGATARRGSANTPNRWKLRRPHDLSRRKHAPPFVRRNGSALLSWNVRTVNSTSHADGLSCEARGKYKRTRSKGVRGANRTNRLVVEPRAHVFTRCDESFN